MGERYLHPTTNLPNDTEIEQVQLSTRIRNALKEAGVKTVGEIREASDEVLLSFQNLGRGSVRYLRRTIGPTKEA